MSETFFNFFNEDFAFFILSIASIEFSFVPNAVNLKNPSPQEPKPLPGVPTIFTFSNNSSKNSHDVNPSGILNHTYGEFFDELLEKANVAGTPGSGFGPSGEGYFRLTSFGTRENTIEAMKRIRGVYERRIY